jgi:hypothetical protein
MTVSIYSAMLGNPSPKQWLLIKAKITHNFPTRLNKRKIYYEYTDCHDSEKDSLL